MDEDFDIEIQNETGTESCKVQLPVNFLTFGEIENDDVKIYIKQDVYITLEQYALEDTAHERGTILLGSFVEDMDKTHVIISNYIEARYTDASASTLTFTHQTWDYVNTVHDLEYPQEKIVGWQHTHPSYGIFLSNYDMFIQENFFNLPFQIAYVIDPIQNLRGFFQWKNGKVVKLHGYYVYDDIGQTIKISHTILQDKPSTPERQINARLYPLLISILTILMTIICFISMFNLRSQLIAQQNQQILLLDRIRQQENELQTPQDNSVINDLTAEVEEQQVLISNLEQEIERIKSGDNSTTSENGYIEYTVKSGDSLTSICKSLNIDYQHYRDVVLGLNCISDENVVRIGQILLFPKAIQYSASD